MNLLDYWPDADRVNACIPSEAEALDPAVFLAVHQPVRLRRRSLTQQSQQPSDEPVTQETLLEALLRADLPQGYVGIPIVGRSGVGKSHLIRWLHVQIQARDSAGHYHVIPIPRSSSLKRVLELILEGLQGSAYDRVREALQSARDKLTPIAAEERLLAEFRAALREVERDCTQKRTEAQQRGQADAPELRDRHSHARGLYGLLEGVTKDALLGPATGSPSVLRVLIQGITEGRLQLGDPLGEAGAELEVPRNQFRPEDFRLETVRKQDVPANSRLYLQRLQAQDDRDRQSACHLMNELRDGAIAQLSGLGEHQLADLFRQVREQLLAEGRELVLLVEDFATVAGVQRSLLDVAIMPGKREGKQILCDMRTALALTDGYLSPWDNMQTRFEYEWVLESTSPDTEQLVTAMTDMVGAYLNAARLGRERLKQELRPGSPPPCFGPVDELTEADQQTLNAFGRSDVGHELFPFNREAVGQLARQYFTRDDQLLWNPRRLINEILRPTLLDQRATYEQGRFPPENFHGFVKDRVGHDVRDLLSAQQGDQFGRACVLQGLWGGCPMSPDQIHLAPEIYRAFGLEPLTVEARGTRRRPVRREPTREPQPEPEPVKRDRRKEEADRRLTMIDKWFTQQVITQSDANWLRGEILEAVNRAIDWDAELLKEINLRTYAGLIERVYLPHARRGEAGVSAGNAIVTLCSDETFADAQKNIEVRRNLEALIRLHVYRDEPFEGSVADRARYSAFAMTAGHQAVAYLRRHYEHVPGDSVPAVAQALLVSARILGIEAALKDDDASVLEAIFAATPTPPTDDDTAWGKLCRACAAERKRGQDFLLRRVAARQGGGDKCLAIDAPRLLAALAPLRTAFVVVAEFPGERLDTDALFVRKHVDSVRAEVVARAARERRDALVTWGEQVRAWLGPDFEKDEVIRDLRETINDAVREDVFRSSVTREKLSERLTQFKKAAVTDTLRAVEKLAAETDIGRQLVLLARIDDEAVAVTRRLHDEVAAFLAGTEEEVGRKIRSYASTVGDETPTAEGLTAHATEELDGLLAELERTVQNLAVDPETPTEVNQ